MIYLNSFKFVDEAREYNFILDEKRTCYDSLSQKIVFLQRGK